MGSLHLCGLQINVPILDEKQALDLQTRENITISSALRQAGLPSPKWPFLCRYSARDLDPSRGGTSPTWPSSRPPAPPFSMHPPLFRPRLRSPTQLVFLFLHPPTSTRESNATVPHWPSSRQSKRDSFRGFVLPPSS